MRFSKRQIVRAALPILAFALIASVVAGRERRSDAPVEPAARVDTRIAPRAADGAEDIDVARIERSHQPTANSPVDPFKRHSFAAPAAGAGTSAGPTAPELPFRYVGKMIDEGKLSVFVARGEESFTLEKGQRIDDYRVDKISESSVVFTYLPLKTKQELNISAAN